MRVLALALCVALLLCAVPATAATKSDLTLTVEATSYPNRARALLSKINALRAQNGLDEYVMLVDLEKVALQRAVELFVHFDHQRPDLTQYYTADDGYAAVKNCVIAGESIAAGVGAAADLFDEWADEENLLSAEFTHVGIACVQVSGSYNGTYWCLYLQQHKAGFKATKAAADAKAGAKKTLTVEIKRGLFAKADNSHRGFVLKADDISLKTRKTAQPSVFLYDKRGVKLGACAADDLSYTSGDTAVCTVLKNGTIQRKGEGTSTVTVKLAGLDAATFRVTVGDPSANQAPAAPTLTAKSYDDHVTLTIYAKDADGYVLYRCATKNGAYRKADETDASGRWSVRLEPGSESKTYYYKVRAYKTVKRERVYGEYSESVKVKQ